MALHLLNGVANEAESTKKIVIITRLSLKSETMGTCKLIHRIPGSRLLQSS